MVVGGWGAVFQRARSFRARGVALADHVVTVLADSGGLAAGLLQRAARGPAATGGAARSGQQHAQPEDGNRPDDNAVEE
jgi:hypothetical protein